MCGRVELCNTGRFRIVTIIFFSRKELDDVQEDRYKEFGGKVVYVKNKLLCMKR